MDWLETLYSLATLGMFIVCACARLISPDADRIARAAAWVTVFTGLSRFVGYFTDAPLSMIHYPAIDCLMMIWSFGWWQVRGERWAWLLGFSFLIQLSLHVYFRYPGSEVSLLNYIRANNGLFIIQLSLLTWAGGGYVAGWIRDRLRLLRRGPAGVLAYGVAS